MRMQDAMMKLLLSQPFYGILATTMAIRESSAMETLEMEALPSPMLYYNREWFGCLSDAYALGALLHELLHLLLLHPLRREDRDPLLWAVCCDMAANEHLLPEMLPPNAVTTERIAEKMQCQLERYKSAEHYYTALHAILDQPGSLLQRENNMVSLSFSDGSALYAKLLNENHKSGMNALALKAQLEALVSRARQSGDISPALMKELETVYEQTGVDWQAVFRRFLNHRGRIESRATYKRQSRRYEGYPGKKRSVGLRVLVALDESGSISDEQFQTFLHELMEVNHGTNAQLLVTEFDTDCTEPKPAEAYRRIKTRTKKGGTDFRPVFSLADSMHISFVLLFTDGQGSTPPAASQRVLWVLTNGGKQPAP